MVMNFLDIVIILPLLYGAWIGFRKGLIIEVCTLLAFVLGIWGGINFSEYVSDWIADNVDVDTEYLPIVAFTITFLAVGALVFFAGKAIEKLINLAALKPLNKLGGLGFGIVKFVFVLSVGLVILEAYDSQSAFIPEKLKKNSLLYEPVKDLSLETIPALKSGLSNDPFKEALKDKALSSNGN